MLHSEGLDDEVCRVLKLDGTPNLDPWKAIVAKVDAAVRPVRIGLIGKYIKLPDAYLSVVESLKHAGFHHGAKVEIEWIQAEEVEGLMAEGRSSTSMAWSSPAGSATEESKARSPPPAMPESTVFLAWGFAWVSR